MIPTYQGGLLESHTYTRLADIDTNINIVLDNQTFVEQQINGIRQHVIILEKIIAKQANKIKELESKTEDALKKNKTLEKRCKHMHNEITRVEKDNQIENSQLKTRVFLLEMSIENMTSKMQRLSIA